MLIPSIPEMNWAEISGQGLGHNWTDVCLTPVYIIITLFTSHRILGWDPSILTMSPMSPSSHSPCSWYLLWSDVSWPADLGRLAPARHWPSLPGLLCTAEHSHSRSGYNEIMRYLSRRCINISLFWVIIQIEAQHNSYRRLYCKPLRIGDGR